ncbi:MAG: hypothetical protein JWL72_2664 [Ilumatobacteraceae bacterium]|nr:hypothetical protein [Ilumatobacteraceae bacterium]MCU1389326.1 hypothetical protein [Ilumatobacteraceae bacterium]
MARRSARRAFIVWGNWGPYHHARFAAARTRLAEAGWELEGVQMYSSSGIYSWSSEAVDGVHDMGLEPPEMQFRPVRTLRTVVPLLFRRRPGVVLLPSYWHWSLMINVFARGLRSRTVMMNDTHAATSATGRYRMAFKAFVVRRFAAGFVAGTPQREFFEGLGLDGARIFTGYDVVDNAHFTAGAEAARAQRAERTAHYGLPDRYLLSLGRLVAKKNLPLVITAYAALRQLLGEATPALVVVGEGDELSALVDQCRGLGLPTIDRHRGEIVECGPGTVLFRPYASYTETPELMGLADAFVLASDSEEWGLVVNEAMSSGTCVIVSDAVGCVPDLCVDDETALVFPSNDAAALTSALERISTDETTRRRVAAAGRRHIDGWGLDRFADGCLRAVESAAKR